MKKLPILTALAVMTFGTLYLTADDDDEHEKKRSTLRYDTHKTIKQASSSPQHQLYLNECGACHMAFQAEFLPKRSWKKMMKGLENHFDVDATVEPEDEKLLAAYLRENAADAKPVARKYAKIANSIPSNSTPLKISDTPYFKKEHRELPKKYISQEEVKSIANCTACHTKADQGNYSERNIFIPNYGKWDD